MSTPAGWYPDPQDGSQERWWNGSGWSDSWQPRAGVPGTPPAPAYGQPPYGGQAPYGGPVPAALPPTHGSAALALVLGILSLFLCGLFTGIPAMVVGRRATREIDSSGGTLGGRGVANAGFWTGLVGTALSALGTLFFIAVFVLAAAAPTPDEETCTVYPDGTSSGC